MRIIVLTKRRTSGKDLLADQYGRVYELARGLAQVGHDVAGIAIGYRNEAEVPPIDIMDENISVQWQGLTIDWRFPWRTFSAVGQYIERFQPHVLWCSGDALQVIAGVRLGQRHGIPVVCDLYDNYEAFRATRIPGVTLAFRRALHASDGVTCVSEPLARFVRDAYRFRGPVEVIENGVNPELFRGMSRHEARANLGIPTGRIYIGTAGSLRKHHGLATLLEAFREVRQEFPEAQLLLAGPLDRRAPLPAGGGVKYLGELPFAKMPDFLASLNVGVILNRDTAFGRFCYPLKLPEMLAARIPIVAAAVGATYELLRNQPEILFYPDDTTDLASKILAQCRSRISPVMEPEPWANLSDKLQRLLWSVTGNTDP